MFLDSLLHEAAARIELRRLIFKALGVDERTMMQVRESEGDRAAFGRYLARTILKNAEGPRDEVKVMLRGAEGDDWSMMLVTVKLDESGEIVKIHADVTLKPASATRVTIHCVQEK